MTKTAFGDRFLESFSDQSPVLHIAFIQWPISLAPLLFTCLLPVLLRYRCGGMAKFGFGISLLFTILLPLQQFFFALEEWYPKVHPWLFGVFFLYAAAGISLCAVGINDRKRSAIWAMIGVAWLTIAAVSDSLVWLGAYHAVPLVPDGFVGFIFFIGIGWFRRRADRAGYPDIRAAAERLTNNRTRRSKSITRKLLREGNLHLFPLYLFMRLSTLGREGIENSGSYRFADHIYQMIPSGKGALGKFIDRKMLELPATQAFHRRYKKSQEAIRQALLSFPLEENPLRVLVVPCGIPREMTELATRLEREAPNLLKRIEYCGMDLDPELLRLAADFTKSCPIPKISFHHGNALLQQQFPGNAFHAVSSTGLGEFLETAELAVFYKNVFDVLIPGGTFFTSSTRREPRSERYLAAFELITQYRTTSDLEALFRKMPWRKLTLIQDDTGLQTFVTAVK